MGWFEPDNGLTAKQEREYFKAYDAKVKALRAAGRGREADKFIRDEHRKYVAWRKDAVRREAG